MRVEKAFKKYLKNYNVEDGSIALKIRHTYEVVNKSEYIAEGLKLDRKTIIDYSVCVIAFIFDLNFDISLQHIKEKNT